MCSSSAPHRHLPEVVFVAFLVLEKLIVSSFSIIHLLQQKRKVGKSSTLAFQEGEWMAWVAIAYLLQALELGIAILIQIFW